MALEDITSQHGRQRRRTMYGGLIILALVGSAVVVFVLDDILAAFQQRYVVVALVPDAPDVVRGTPVWVSGKAVGEVKSVAIRPSSVDTLGRVAVELDLPRSVQPQVRADSRVRLTSAGLMGEAVVDIIPGSAQAPALQEYDTIRSQPQLTREQLTARAAALRQDFAAVTAEARQLAPLVRARMDDTRSAFTALDATMLEARRIQSDLQANPGLALVRDPAFQQSLANVQAHAAALPATLAQFQARVGATGEIMTAVERLRARADTLAAQLDAAAAMLDQPVGTLGRLQNDAALVRAIEAARASLDSLVAEARRNPLRFVF
jgi:hypothetical protein